MTNAKRLTKKLLACLLCICLVLPLFSSAFVPLAAELKAALTVESSAASTTDLTTINYTSGGYHYYYYQSGATFVSSVDVRSKGQLSTTNLANQIKNAGNYYPTDYDLNDNAGGDYVKFGFGMSADPTVAYTKMAISSSYSGCEIGSSKQWPAYYRFATSGTAYTVTWEQSSNVDLNKGAGGAYLYFCNTHDTRVGAPLTFIYAVEGGSNVNYARYLNNSAYADLNQDAGGDYIYLMQEDVAQTNRACHDNHKYVNTTGTTDVSAAIQQLQDTYNTYNNYLVSGRYTTATYNALNTALDNAATVISDFSDYYSSTYTAAAISPYVQAIIDAANALETTVYFDATTNGGTTSTTSATIKVGTDDSGKYDFVTSNTATKSGWTFSGWSLDKTSVSGATSFTVGFNTTLYAIFTKSVSVQFTYLNAAGTSTQRSDSVVYYNTDTQKTLTAPAGIASVSKGGTFTLLGFRQDTTATDAEIAPSATITIPASATAASYKYYAVYSRDNLTLSFDANSGAGAPAALTAKQYLNAAGARTTADFTIPDDVPTLDGYEFQGWSTTKNGAVEYQPGDTVTLDYDDVLYASWKTATYTVTYDVNGGNAIANLDYTTEENKALATPTRTGYKFNGWTVQSTDGTWVVGNNYPAGSSVKGMIGDVTLVANWTAQPVTYSVYHYGQKADGSGYEQIHVQSGLTAVADSELVIADLVISQTGFSYDHAEVNGAVYSEANVTVAADGSLVLNLYYDRESFTVTATAGNGIESVTGTGEYLYGAEVVLTANVTDGYTFSGWTGSLSGDTATLKFTVSSDVDVTANANIVTYTIGYNKGATDAVLSGTYTESYTVLDAITLPVASRPGYDLAGWTVTSAELNKAFGWEDTYGVVSTIDAGVWGNVVLTANWTPKTYTITFDENGGDAVADIEYNITQATTLPETLKYGYMFKGWIATTVEGNWILNGEYAKGASVNGQYGNVTLTAAFTQIPYTLSFDANGGSVSPSYVTYNIENENNALLPTPVRPGYTFNGWECIEAWADENDALNACDWVVGTVYEAGLDLTNIAGNAKFKATWTANNYDLTANVTNAVFNGTAGTDVLTAGVDYAATLTTATGYELDKAATVTIDGKAAVAGLDYTYTCASDRASATLTVKGTSIVGDVVVTVGASLKEYTITYIGVNAGHSFPMTYTIESEEIVIGEADRSGYRFDGWTGTDLDEMTKSIVIPTGSTGNREYTANWTKAYRVEFVTTGDPIDAIKYVPGEDITIPTPTKEGYKFRYYTVTGAWSESQIMPGTYSGKTGDVTLTAVFSAPTSYTVEEYFMDTNGNYGTPVSTSYSENVFVDDTATASFGTYTGFTADSSASKLSGTILADGALKLKLYYARNKYNVNVDADENIASVVGAGSYYYDEKVTVTAVPKGGYAIVGWTGDYESTDASIGFTMGTEDVNLAVTSKFITYTIEFVVDGGTAPESIVYNPASPVTLPNLEKVGYDMYWVLAADEGSWSAGNIAPGAYSDMYGDIILSALWVAKNDTPYIVENYFQNIENDEYAEAVVENKTGTTDTAVVMPADYEGFTTPAPSALTVNGDGSTVVQYYYTRNTYSVTYKVNGVDDKVDYKYGATIVKPEDPVVGGYRFNGWDQEIATVMPAENLVYTADLTLLNYTITFSGAMGDAIPAITYNVTQSVVLPQITEPGYSVMWTLAADSGNWTAGSYAPATYPAGMYGNLALKANNTPNTNTPYTVETYLQNLDGTYADAVVETMYGTTAAVVDAPVVIEGFFTPAASKLTIKGDGSTVVKYTYNRASFTVSYDVLGSVTTDTYLYEAPITAPADPVAGGYEFVKWDSEIASIMPAENLTYTAQFNAIEYTVTFDADGGSDVAALSYDITADVTVPESTRSGFRFVNWEVVTADGNWHAGEVLGETISGKYGDITVKAVWSEKKANYTVETYYMGVNGEYATVADSVETFVGLVDETAVYDMPAVEGFAVDTDNSILSATIMEDGTTVLKAYYARNQYTLTTSVEGNGAVSITAGGTYYYGEEVNIEVDLKDHYTVESWSGVDAQGNNAVVTMPASNIAVHAVVAPIVYTVTVDMADGNDATVIEYTVESDVTVPDAERVAYTFDGWTLTAEGSNWTQDEVTVGAVLNGKYGDVTLTANWTVVTYTYAYDVNGGTMPETYYYNEDTYNVETKIVLPVPTKTGYRFKGWVATNATDGKEFNWEASFDRNADLIGVGRYGDVVLTATWLELDVEVYVEHYLQYTWGDEYILLDKYTDYHKADSTINIKDEVAKSNPGAYHYEKAYVNGSDTVSETATVAADGTTTIKVYYLLDVHNVTVNYVTPDGVTAPETYVGAFRYGQTYNVKSPAVVGYEPSSVTVSGKMEFTDVEATVTYELSSYDVTVNYYYANGSVAKESVTQTVPYGAAYSIATPEIAGYTPSIAVVEGTMEGADVDVDVIYGVNTHTLTIHYVYADGSAAADDYVAELEFGYAYNVKSADVVGHNASSPYVSGSMPDADAEITVTYTPKTYTVIFRDHDGTDLSVQSVVYGNAATAPADPVRADDDTYSYTFKGWSEDFSNVSGDMVITAEYISTNLATGETSGDEEVDDSFFGKLKAFFQRLIKFLKVLFIIT